MQCVWKIQLLMKFGPSGDGWLDGIDSHMVEPGGEVVPATAQQYTQVSRQQQRS